MDKSYVEVFEDVNHLAAGDQEVAGTAVQGTHILIARLMIVMMIIHNFKFLNNNLKML